METVLSGCKLLVVEDNRPVRMLLRTILQEAGATVTEAEHGEQAWRLLDLDKSFDAIVTDLAMPNMGGDALVRAVRNRGDTLPIILCSAAVLLHDHALVHERLVQAVVAKPFQPQQLISEIAGAVRQPHSAVAR